MGNPPMVLVSGFDPLESVGGHQSYVHAHALAVMRLGFEPHIFCGGRGIDTVRTDFGIIHRVRAQLPFVLQQPLFARAVTHFLKEQEQPGPHVIHGFASWSVAAALATRSLRRRGVEAIAIASAYATRAYESHAMQGGLQRHTFSHRLRYASLLRWIQLIDRPIEGWGYANAKVVLVNYESVRRILLKAYPGSLPTIRHMPYTIAEAFEQDKSDGANKTQKARRDSASEDPLILAVSRHVPRKGLDVLLLALAELAAKDVPFHACLVGPGRLLDAHRALASELGLSERVSILGWVAEVGPYLDRADVFVLPSLAEASGSVSIIEALRSKIAVIASACDGIPEDLTDEYDALLVPPGDAQALADALHRLLTDPALRGQLGKMGRRTYEQRFSATGLAAALSTLFAELGIPVPLPAAPLPAHEKNGRRPRQ